ncbi:MAG: UvrB/UvrC motif-containing protein, partial [Gammaproteobacteria bacterium]
EGLDMPEVSLVAILDSDKEGFLRSERSLIQTIGRAARNLNGTAILYADQETGSMRRAIDETTRRRDRQLAFNAEHGIVPVGVKKQVMDIMEGAHGAGGRTRSRLRGGSDIGSHPHAEEMRPGDVGKEIAQLELQMYQHARNLEFEEAARIRDRLAALKEQLFASA